MTSALDFHAPGSSPEELEFTKSWIKILQLDLHLPKLSTGALPQAKHLRLLFLTFFGKDHSPGSPHHVISAVARVLLGSDLDKELS